jgi:hypothetical protein
MTWKWLIWTTAVPVVAVAAVAAGGTLLPREHVVTGQLFVRASPDRVADLVRDVPSQPRWRKGLRSIEVLERRSHGLRYVERSSDGAITFDFVEEQPGRLFRSAIADPKLPFGGEWTIAITPEGGGSSIRIEERGFVTNVFFRFFAALIFGYDRTIRSYLLDLNAALSDSPS